MRPQFTVSMRRSLFLALSLLLLSGCTMIHLTNRVARLAHPDYSGPLRDAKSPASVRLKQDINECGTGLTLTQPAPTFQDGEDAIFSCLYARGWREPGP